MPRLDKQIAEGLLNQAPERFRNRPVRTRDRAERATDRRAVTNHPETVEWPEHSAWVGSVERLDLLQAMSSAGADDVTITEALLQPPLLAREWDAGFATLFTAAYRPASGRLDYHWPHQRLRHCHR